MPKNRDRGERRVVDRTIGTNLEYQAVDFPSHFQHPYASVSERNSQKAIAEILLQAGTAIAVD